MLATATPRSRIAVVWATVPRTEFFVWSETVFTSTSTEYSVAVSLLFHSDFWESHDVSAVDAAGLKAITQEYWDWRTDAELILSEQPDSEDLSLDDIYGQPSTLDVDYVVWKYICSRVGAGTGLWDLHGADKALITKFHELTRKQGYIEGLFQSGDRLIVV